MAATSCLQITGKKAALGKDSVDSCSTGEGKNPRVLGRLGRLLLGITHSGILYRAVTPAGLLEQYKNLVGCLPRTV